MRTSHALVFAALALTAVAPAGARTLIHAGHLIDGIADTPREAVTVVIDDGRIAEIRDGFASPGADDSVVDLRAHTVMPGLMDMHTHLTTEFHADVYLERFQLEPADVAYRSVGWAEKTLMAGFTTVRDLIKITATGGVLSVAKSGQNPQFLDGPSTAACATL